MTRRAIEVPPYSGEVPPLCANPNTPRSMKYEPVFLPVVPSYAYRIVEAVSLEPFETDLDRDKCFRIISRPQPRSGLIAQRRAASSTDGAWQDWDGKRWAGPTPEHATVTPAEF